MTTMQAEGLGGPMVVLFLISAVICGPVGYWIGRLRGWAGAGTALGICFGPLGCLLAALLPCRPEVAALNEMLKASIIQELEGRADRGFADNLKFLKRLGAGRARRRLNRQAEVTAQRAIYDPQIRRAQEATDDKDERAFAAWRTQEKAARQG